MSMQETPTPPEGWSSHANALRFRKWLRSFVLNVLEEERPGMKFATVVSIDREAGTCNVVYQGDTDSVPVRMYAIQPSAAGQAVIIDGPRQRRHVAQALGQVFIPGVASVGWLQVSDAAIGRYAGFAAGTGTKVYFGGGVDEAGTMTSFVSYDVELRNWTVLLSLPEGRVYPGADFVGTDLYIVGGQDDSNIYDTIWKYDTVTDAWDDTLASMPTTASQPGVAEFAGNLFVFGGISSFSPLVYEDSCYQYDVGMDSWSSVADLPVPLSSVTARTIGTMIYVFGVDNEEGVNRLYAYDPGLDAYTELTSFPEMVYSAAVASFGGRVVVAGGVDMLTFTSLQKVYMYDPASTLWLGLDDLPTASLSAVTAEGGGKLVFSGGATDFDSSTPLATTFVYTPS